MTASLGTIKEVELNGRKFLIHHTFLEMVASVGPFRGRTYLYPTINSVLSLIKENVPEHFSFRDDNGSLPLHIAVSARCLPEESSLFKILIDECPQSCSIPDGQGRLALHMALDNGLSCVDTLVEAELRALATRCIVTHMYPYQLAAYGLVEEKTQLSEDTTLVDSTYKLLRGAPHLIRHTSDAARELLMNSSIYKEYQMNKLKIAQLEARNAQLTHDRDEATG